ncbi:MAG: DNA replication and repair protein RecF [Actinomycetota bacterium]
MRFLWVELRDFRNHQATKLDVPDGLVVVSGPNGEGKTNLLEGMYYVVGLASPRVSSSEPLVRRGVDAAYARGEVQTAGGRLLVEVEIPVTGASKVQVNRSPVRRKRDIRRQVRGVFFGPDDLSVVLGDPGERRRFMDEAAQALWPLKESELKAYDKSLRQRNRLLKEWEGSGAPPDLEAWDEELIEAGSAVTRVRADAVARLGPHASADFQTLSEYALAVTYRPNVEAEEVERGFRERLAARRDDELIRRTTLVGPHRDELDLAVRDLRARAFASHGEAWGAALALRLGLASAVAEEIGEPPVILLDDPFSALDPARRERIAAGLPGRGQVVVSVADEAHVPLGAEAVWTVAGGVVAVDA